MADHSLWQRAAAFAARAHQHQCRKDSGTPYVSHPFRVAMTVRHVFGCDDETIIAAALLHDVIEDCGVDYDEIAEELNHEVATLVALMSKDTRIIEDQRERLYDEQLANGSWKARMIKLADTFDNVSDAPTPELKVRMLGKARRALALSKNDPELDRARGIVQQLIDSAGA